MDIGQKWWEGFLHAEVLVRKWSLSIERENILMNVKIGFDIEVCKSWNLAMRLVRIGLVECSKACKCLITFSNNIRKCSGLS